jgi:hypothetical protein
MAASAAAPAVSVGYNTTDPMSDPIHEDREAGGVAEGSVLPTTNLLSEVFETC